jgi:hypothetical protein
LLPGLPARATLVWNSWGYYYCMSRAAATPPGCTNEWQKLTRVIILPYLTLI